MSDTIARLNAAGRLLPTTASGDTRLRAMSDFGSNPGALSAFCHVPGDAAGLPLVVVLHGCTQTAAGYDRGSGWSALADRFGFAVLFAEQTRSNNGNGCFNWFEPGDVRRDSGEALSIRQMIAAMVERHAIDPARVFVTGLSAGGAMASAMLATYPEVFAGGAIIAGLPYGAAASVSQAFDRMRGHGHPGDDDYAAAIRAASSHAGPWPSISIWQGSADHTVAAVNADRIVGQWRALNALPAEPTREGDVDGVRHRVWEHPKGDIAIEDYRIPGMGHGTPLRIDGDTACGMAMPHMLEAGISSTWHIAERWGLLTVERVRPAVEKRQTAAVDTAPPAFGIQETIEAALRSAGLMR